MAHIYFTRHGQTVWNVENKICGMTDIELTKLGHRQAEELGVFIRNNDIHIDEILYSPLIRAAETARHISEVTGIQRREEVRLIEQNFGKYESTPRDGKEFAQAKTHFLEHYDGGETMFHVAQRVYNLLDEIKLEADHKIYLLVAHGGIGRVINSYFYDMTNEQFANFSIKNCELKEYVFW
jgi:broad specificity phosphatase PhoE